ncbi:50S ribosomal protein L4 [bacterium]|jgi:large subunit ribosomal protein L4|nr:50S ribosomal protein L4 [Verrucomicrobiota bacterium]MDC0277109.1 50S ribosomal protein L4 [bacterium]MBT3842230.1 50S ribosomal protein L4 [Verrucomicrobiota bacterium]MBT3912956.1 50S ribosomal protein L4 [Verrucomicrobiota bacterium]MBT4226230.1 50S ribosomal protein L4 [Verrucomicrobiota bacterium]
MKVAIKDTNGADKGEQEAKFTPVDDDKGNQAVHEAVVAYNAAQRSGNACTKTVGEVAGTGAKPWRQKGTGRARVGYKRNPIWRGGGVAHGPKPRVYIKKLNKKVRDLAIRKAFTERVKDGQVVILDGLNLDKPATSQLSKTLTALGIDARKPATAKFKSAVLVTGEADNNIALSARNIERIRSTTSDTLTTYEILWPDVLVFTTDGYEQFELRLNK